MIEEEMVASSAAARAALETYCDDLTALARGSRFAPLSGRDAEIERIFQILARPSRSKGNPLLIGDAGPERRAVVIEVVRWIAIGHMPERVSAQRVMALDTERLIAGITQRGELEERAKLILQAVRETAGQTMLFVDDFHRLVGGPPEPSIDIANLWKPFLGRSEGRVFGTSTLDEYRIYIEKDAALQRRFQEVLLQLSPEPALSAGSSM
jgi:ATP-dependent Clp protease ATP-binding subunit ClpB